MPHRQHIAARAYANKQARLVQSLVKRGVVGCWLFKHNYVMPQKGLLALGANRAFLAFVAYILLIPTPRTIKLGQKAVQMDDALTARSFEQIIDILRYYKKPFFKFSLKLGDYLVGVVWRDIFKLRSPFVVKLKHFFGIFRKACGGANLHHIVIFPKSAAVSKGF